MRVSKDFWSKGPEPVVTKLLVGLLLVSVVGNNFNTLNAFAESLPTGMSNGGGQFVGLGPNTMPEWPQEGPRPEPSEFGLLAGSSSELEVSVSLPLPIW